MEFREVGTDVFSESEKLDFLSHVVLVHTGLFLMVHAIVIFLKQCCLGADT